MSRRKKQMPGVGHEPSIGYKDSIGSAYKLEQSHPSSREYRRKYARWVKKGKPLPPAQPYAKEL